MLIHERTIFGSYFFSPLCTHVVTRHTCVCNNNSASTTHNAEGAFANSVFCYCPTIAETDFCFCSCWFGPATWYWHWFLVATSTLIRSATTTTTPTMKKHTNYAICGADLQFAALCNENIKWSFLPAFNKSVLLLLYGISFGSSSVALKWSISNECDCCKKLLYKKDFSRMAIVGRSRGHSAKIEFRSTFSSSFFFFLVVVISPLTFCLSNRFLCVIHFTFILANSHDIKFLASLFHTSFSGYQFFVVGLSFD